MATTIGNIVAKLSLNIENFSSNLSKVQNDIKQTKQKLEGLGNLGSGLSNAGSALTKTITLPIIGIGTAATKASSDFEQAMSKVKAISGATAKDMELLNEKAIEMGAKTKFSAKESADAFTYMAMAGWDTKAMLDGIDGIMNLAAADGLDLATTSDIVTDAITAFGLAAKDSAHFADVLAVASSSSNTNVQMLGESFKYVAPVAGALGYSVEDTAVALGLMANSGIKASQAGTSLRAALTRMVKPTENAAMWMKDLGIEIVNSDGSMKSLDEVMNILRKTMGGLTQEQQTQAAATMFGQEAMSGMLAIINSSDSDFEKLKNSIYNADGAAQNMAETMMDNTAGAIEQMMGSLETLAIQIGNILTPTIRAVAGAIQNFSDWLGSLDKDTQELIVKIGLFVAAIGPVLLIVGKMITAFISLKAGFVVLSGVASTVGSLFSTILIPVITSVAKVLGLMLLGAIKSVVVFITGSLIPALTTVVTFIVNMLLTTLIKVITFIIATAIPAIGSFLVALLPFLPWIALAVAAITAIILVIKNWGAICDWFGGVFSSLLGIVSNIIDGIVGFFRNLGNSIASTFNNIVSGIVSWGSNAWNAAKSAANSIVDAIVGTLSSLPSKAVEWGKDMIDGFAKGVKKTVGKVGDAVKGVADTITGWLHFSRPDVGPLREYEKWMPDMIQGLSRTLDNSKGRLIDSVRSLSNGMSKTFNPNLSLATTYGALNHSVGEYERIVENNNNNPRDDKNNPKSNGGVVINLNIERFENNTDKDIKELTREVMEVAAEENKRKGGAFDEN